MAENEERDLQRTAWSATAVYLQLSVGGVNFLLVLCGNLGVSFVGAPPVQTCCSRPRASE